MAIVHCLGVAGISGPIRSCASFAMADFQSIQADARWRWLYLERQEINAFVIGLYLSLPTDLSC